MWEYPEWSQLASESVYPDLSSLQVLMSFRMVCKSMYFGSRLALCDLAGSERCAKTQNKGDRLKEAGNINTSLLSLGKCINALRNNHQARYTIFFSLLIFVFFSFSLSFKLLFCPFRQHVPFRESKLTHYLQGYFTGRGKACMIVNINQCASMYDETLNVLKFSAVAQKVCNFLI